MSDELIVVELTLEDGKYKGRMKQAGALARAFHGEIKRSDRAAKSFARTLTGGVVPALRDWSIIIGQARNVLHQLWYVTGAWTQSLIRTSAEVERLTFLMKGMSDAASDTARMQEAKDNVDALFEAAKNAPFSINALSDSFVKFKSVGIDPLDGSLQSLTNAVAAFGGTDETLHRASIAIQQMAGKGVISMEELRQQLGEAVPQAITIMAQSMGTSYGKLVKEISKGTVEAKPAIEAMLNGFEIVFGGRAQSMMDTYNGRVAKMKTAWTELVSENTGIQNFFESQKDLISDFTDLLGSDSVDEIASNIGNGLSSLVDGISSLMQKFVLVYGKAKAFISLINKASMNPDSFVYQYKKALQSAVEFAVEAGKQFGELVKKVTLWATNMTAEEYNEMMLAERIKTGGEIASEEMDDVLAMLDKTNAEIAEKTFNVDQIKKNLFTSLNNDIEDMARRRQEFVSVEQVETAIERFQLMNRELKSMSVERDRLARNADSITRSATDENGLVDVSKLARASSMREQVEELDRQRREIQKKYRDLEYMIAYFAQKTGQSFEDVIAGSVKTFGDLRRNADLTTEDLKTIVERSRGVSALAADQLIVVQEKVEELSGMRISIEEIIDTDLNRRADGIFDTYMDEIEKFRSDATSTAADMMEQVNEAMTSTAGSQEDRYAQASQIVEEYYDKQMGSLNTILAASQEAMIAQGEAGALAAAQLGEVVMGILNALGSAKDGLLASLKTGIPTIPSTGGSGGRSKSQRSMDKLTDMIKAANAEAEKLGKVFEDPFGFHLPKAIDKAREKIDKLAEEISGGKWTQQMKDLFDVMATNAATEEMIKMAEATRDIERSLMGERQARNQVYDEEVRRIKQMKAKLIEMGIWRVEWEQTVQDQLLALQQEHQSQSPLGEFFNEWKDLYDDIEQVGVDTVKGLSKGIADMVTEGEADFASLARSAANSFIQIGLNAGLSGIMSKFFPNIPNGFGGFGSTPIPSGIPGSGGIYHSGDIVGSGGRSRSVDMSIFSNAPRYHTGGVIGQEVPAILEKGEGVFTPAQMKALGANMGGGDVEVNIINNSGQPLEAEQTNKRIDGERMIADVMVKLANRPGPVRDALKGAK